MLQEIQKNSFHYELTKEQAIFCDGRHGSLPSNILSPSGNQSPFKRTYIIYEFPSGMPE